MWRRGFAGHVHGSKPFAHWFQNSTVAADLAYLETLNDDYSFAASHETEINDAEAAQAAQDYNRIKEDMLLSVKYKVFTSVGIYNQPVHLVSLRAKISKEQFYYFMPVLLCLQLVQNVRKTPTSFNYIL